MKKLHERIRKPIAPPMRIEKDAKKEASRMACRMASTNDMLPDDGDEWYEETPCAAHNGEWSGECRMGAHIIKHQGSATP